MSPSPTPPRDSSSSVALHLPDGHGHSHHSHHNHSSQLGSGCSMSSRQVYLLKGEISLLLCSLRRNSQQRWSSHQQDPKADYPLLKQLQALKESLESELRMCMSRMSKDANYFLVPFLDVIRSEDTSGPITVLALNAVEKFISYDLVHENNGGTAAVEAITDAVIHARFVSSDSASDELVLMKILQVLHRLFISRVGSVLSNEAVCELMQSCLRMCFIERANDLLKKFAETALHDMVRVLFMRVKEFPVVFGKKMKSADSSSHLAIEVSEENSPRHASTEQSVENGASSAEIPEGTGDSIVVESPTSEALPTTPQLPEANTVAIDIDLEAQDGQALSAAPDSETHLTPVSNKVPVINIVHPTPTQDATPRNLNPNIVEFKNRRGIKFTNASSAVSSEIQEEEEPTEQEKSSEDDSNKRMNTPYGIPCVRELLRFLVSLINPHDKQNTEMMVHLGLKLLLVAVESDMEGISKHPQLCAIVRNEFVKNLIALLSWQNTNTVILLNVMRILFIIFETMRSSMKYQLEIFLSKVMELIGDGQQLQGPLPVQNQNQPNWNYEQRDIALDYLIQLWKLPTLVTELYLNYDCDLFCSNLFEDLTKLLSKNAFPMQTGINTIHLHCLDGLVSILDGIEVHCTTRLSSTTNISASSDESNSSVFYHEYEPNEVRYDKCEESEALPTHEQLMAIRHKKKILHSGCEQFNQHAGKGIAFLQSQGLLSNPLDTTEMAQFLRDNPLLDKKTIGDYISTKKNHEVLKAFVTSFEFQNTRIDEALRLFLETFRLPGEAPLISHVLEEFSDHWFLSNNSPFANVDAAFTLSYGVIMLNVDQHNTNVKKNSNSMTLEEFRKNLKGVNGGQDFDPNMLQQIYVSIKSEEIIMPAEQTGVVKENYMWKVMLRRGVTSKSKYLCPTSDEGLYDHDLFSLSWGPIVAALSFIFDKTLDTLIITKSLNGFKKCATISAHYGMSDVFDNLVISLCKFTTLLSGNCELGSSMKAQSACRSVFQLVHRHGGILREGWHNFIDCLIALFKSQSLPKILTESEDFTEPSGRCSLIRGSQIATPRVETGLLSSIYSYIAMSSSDSSLGNKSTVDEEETKKKTANLIRECQPELLLSESKFLPLDSLNELVKNLIYTSPVPESSRRKDYDEDSVVFVLEVLIKISIQNRDRVMVFWDPLREHLFSMIYASASCDMPYLLERATVGLLRLALRLMRKEDLCGIVLQSLKILLYLRPSYVMQLSQQMSFGLHEILKTTAANIHTTEEWTIIFALLEYVGAGRVPSGNAFNQPPVNPQMLISSSGSDPNLAAMDNKPPGLQHSLSQDPISSVANSQIGYSSGSDRGYTSDSELEIRSQNSSETRLSSVSPAQSWILLTHNTEDGNSPAAGTNPTTSPTRSPKAIQHERLQQQLNFTPDPKALLKSCETLSFLVRDAAHITPDNFTLCVGAIRSFVEACSVRLYGTQKGGTGSGAPNRKLKRGKRFHSPEHSIPKSKSFPASTNTSAYDADYESDPEADQIAASHQCSIQLLDLLHTLHTRASQIFQWWQKENQTTTTESLWTLGWKPLLQTIGLLCCDTRKQVRTTALTYLQRALLVHDLQQLAPSEWCSCFNEVLFPLMTRLLEPINPMDPQGMEETRMRAATLLCKVFLQHLTPLMGVEGFNHLWVEILSVMERYMKCDQKCELLTEAIPESLKNLLLVMDTAGIFHTPDGYTKLWVLTWEKIDSFLPNLRAEMFAAVQISNNNPNNPNNNPATGNAAPPPQSPVPGTAVAPPQLPPPSANPPSPTTQSSQVQSQQQQHTEVILDA
ncbi:Golgi-specific brefeldin A-resistance guanine nucleotide exchange factor 1 [Orchesella cincta]|uniref:Golgi-specific brefeldin A-resistance guanine nucleotide exchange factor 1 n=1 Tax=Orchesella cincta TaxID=48709 RepID=A0A1D2N7K5_ORCCI|nr:Golgi-specific brefeldin A-resistance guanine nucleotide exchange factor 1 [Orchesella cincta]